MKYLSIDICTELVFPYIHAQLTDSEPASNYARKESAMAELEKIMHFSKAI